MQVYPICQRVPFFQQLGYYQPFNLSTARPGRHFGKEKTLERSRAFENNTVPYRTFWSSFFAFSRTSGGNILVIRILTSGGLLGSHTATENNPSNIP